MIFLPLPSIHSSPIKYPYNSRPAHHPGDKPDGTHTESCPCCPNSSPKPCRYTGQSRRRRRRHTARICFRLSCRLLCCVRDGVSYLPRFMWICDGIIHGKHRSDKTYQNGSASRVNDSSVSPGYLVKVIKQQFVACTETAAASSARRAR